MEVDPTTERITFTCTGDRLYDLMSRTDLTVERWEPVPGLTNLVGSAIGTMTIEDIPETRKFYKVDLHLRTEARQ